MLPPELPNISIAPFANSRKYNVSLLPGFDATQHIITNTLVNIDGSEAEAIAYVRATHRLGDRFWIVGGYYTYQLEQQKRGWKIRSLKLTAQYEKGDRALLQQAGDRSSRLR